MPPMLDVSDAVRAEIGDEEAERLLAGENAPSTYDCTSCRTPGDSGRERTSTVLFVGQETAVLAFAHATCVPSQVVTVSEEQLHGAVRVPHRGRRRRPRAGRRARRRTDPAGARRSGLPPVPVDRQAGARRHQRGGAGGRGAAYPALVVEPTGPIIRPGRDGPDDEFLTLLTEHGFAPVVDVAQAPQTLPGWSVLLAMGRLHAVLMPASGGGSRPTGGRGGRRTSPCRSPRAGEPP